MLRSQTSEILLLPLADGATAGNNAVCADGLQRRARIESVSPTLLLKPLALTLSLDGAATPSAPRPTPASAPAPAPAPADPAKAAVPKVSTAPYGGGVASRIARRRMERHASKAIYKRPSRSLATGHTTPEAERAQSPPPSPTSITAPVFASPLPMRELASPPLLHKRRPSATLCSRVPTLNLHLIAPIATRPVARAA
jgi:hypothetical protein